MAKGLGNQKKPQKTTENIKHPSFWSSRLAPWRPQKGVNGCRSPSKTTRIAERAIEPFFYRRIMIFYVFPCISIRHPWVPGLILGKQSHKYFRTRYPSHRFLLFFHVCDHCFTLFCSFFKTANLLKVQIFIDVSLKIVVFEGHQGTLLDNFWALFGSGQKLEAP